MGIAIAMGSSIQFMQTGSKGHFYLYQARVVPSSVAPLLRARLPDFSEQECSGHCQTDPSGWWHHK